MLDGNHVYVQAARSLVKLDRKTGKAVWRGAEEESGGGDEYNSAFASPCFAVIAGVPQVLAQMRTFLAGVDPETGRVLWKTEVPAFRGMNILTPVAHNDRVFTSTHKNASFLYEVSRTNDTFRVRESWRNPAMGYMSSPVQREGHVYFHLGNGRFVGIRLEDGKTVWTSKPYGHYASLIIQGDRILALTDLGDLLLFRAAPEAFDLLGEAKLGVSNTWAHLAVRGHELYVRPLESLVALRWE
jgi:outer membrane protein assembly factor BamB